MITSLMTVRVTCPKCLTRYTDHYLPAVAIPEIEGPARDYADDSVLASCPACNHLINIIVRVDGGRMPGDRGTGRERDTPR
jgi:hypothetical protein